MPARSVCLLTLSLSEAGPGRFGGQVSVTDIYHTIPSHTVALTIDHPSYPASAWLTQLRTYAMPSVPVPPVTLIGLRLPNADH